jgi:hypothetical protein
MIRQIANIVGDVYVKSGKTTDQVKIGWNYKPEGRKGEEHQGDDGQGISRA